MLRFDGSGAPNADEPQPTSEQLTQWKCEWSGRHP